MVILGFIVDICGVIESLTVPFDPVVYFQIYFIYLIPNLLLFSAVVFAVVIFSRNTYAGFITVIVLLLVREVVMKLTGGTSDGLPYVLSDPFCESATYFYTATYSIAQMNLIDIPSGTFIFYNRLLWISISAFILFCVYRNFSFSRSAVSFNFKKTIPERIIKNNFGGIDKIKLPVVSYQIWFAYKLKVAWKLSGSDFKCIISGGSFISILIAGSLLVMIILLQMNPQYDNRLLPLAMGDAWFSGVLLSTIINLLTFLYAGVLIHR